MHTSPLRPWKICKRPCRGFLPRQKAHPDNGYLKNKTLADPSKI